jgi:peptidyl-prolyl cis-trans isomerase B (cyclophilin B)
MKRTIGLFLLAVTAAFIFSGCNGEPKESSSSENQNSVDVSEKDSVGKKTEENKDTVSVQSVNSENSLASKYKYAFIKTNYGDIKVKFYNEDAPKTVENFLKLAQSGFYDGTKFHRVIFDFMIQGGDPNSKDNDWSDDGTGDPGYKFADEINNHKLVRGSLAMANSGPNTNGSQFFIVTKSATPWLDGKHTNFGELIDGYDTVMKIEKLEVDANAHPLEYAVINKIELLEK